MFLRVLGAAVVALSGLSSALGGAIGESFELFFSQASHEARSGQAVAGYCDTVVAGAPFEDILGDDSGIAFIVDGVTGVRRSVLLASDGSAGDQFGTAVAIGEGAIAVGAWMRDEGVQDAGAVYIFDPDTRDERFKLLAPTPQGGDLFGASLAIEGGIVAIGAPGDDAGGVDAGAVYLYDLTSGAMLRKLVSQDPTPGALFGTSVALEGKHLMIGAPRATRLGEQTGSAYLFDVDSGVQLVEFVTPGVDPGAEFGYSVAIELPHIAVGARFDGTNAVFGGAVFMFDVLGEPVRFISPENPQAGDTFGWSIALSEGFLGVGAPLHRGDFGPSGAAFLFDASTGEQLANTAPETILFGNSQFGASVAFIEDEMVVGNPGRVTAVGRIGGAIVFFSKPTPTLTQPATILSSPTTRSDYSYGDSMIRTDELLIIAEPALRVSGPTITGRVYVHDAQTGELLYELPEPGLVERGANFGASIEVAGDILAVGANSDHNRDSGMAYLYDLTTGTLIASIASPQPERGDRFGETIEIEGDLLAIASSRLQIDGFDEEGIVWIFDLHTRELLRTISPAGSNYRGFGDEMTLRDGTLVVSALNSGSLVGVFGFDIMSGEELYRIAPPSPNREGFGRSLALGNGKLVVGWLPTDPVARQGEIQVFDAATGEFLMPLVPNDGLLGAGLGGSVSIHNGLVLVGAELNDDNGLDTGSAYLFDLDSGRQLLKFTQPTPEREAHFGRSVHLTNNQAIIASRLQGPGNSEQDEIHGGVFVFGIQPPCPADLNNSGIIDMQDLNILLAKYGAPVTAGVLGDIDNSGVIDLPDLNAFLIAFGTDCP